ncbi:peptidase [Gemella sp. ND 6198]|nr:peptidase [Gemella sp. ND 6198]
MKNIYLKVEKDGNITVSAPPKTPNYIIKKLVCDNIKEVKTRIENINQSNSSREYVTGEKFYIFGKERKLLVENADKNFLVISNSIILGITDKTDKEKFMGRKLRQVLLTEAREFVKHYERIMNVKVNELRIKKMKTRWGTCNIEKQRIWVNEELTKYPIECLEHIVVHEMTHLLETHHTPRFYKLLGKFYPNYKENDKLLREFSKKS